MLLQVAPNIIETTQNRFQVLDLIWQADPVVKLVVLILVFFSILCWGIILSKRAQLTYSLRHTEKFLEAFDKESSVKDLKLKRSQKKGAAFHIFESVITRLADLNGQSHPNLKTSIMRKAYNNEIERLEMGLSFLATTASSAPFIGLFGTVWGILSAFWKIGQTGASSLAIVGPHIAEALIATAIGLFAAIPAAMFYNIFVEKIRKIDRHLESFIDDLAIKLTE